MFTDIVGYSSLTHSNEMLSLELLQEHRALVRPLIEQFNGHVIDTAGDGFAVEFASTFNAVQCAIAIQKTFAERNKVESEERKIKLRIGVHTADVLESEKDSGHGIYGDGVNIAARLQPLAPQGGICISGAVFEQIQGKLDYPIHSMGTPKLKGIKTPIRLYSVEVLTPSVQRLWRRKANGLLRSREGKIFAAIAVMVLFAGVTWLSQDVQKLFSPRIETSKKEHRIAILPFESKGLAGDEAYISDGIVGAIIGALSQKGFHILAQDSVLELKRTHKSPQEIGRDLNIGQLLTGRLNQQGDSIKASISLVDTNSQEVLWTKDFVHGAKEIFELQKDIVAAVAQHLASVDKKSLATNSTSSASVAPVPPKKEAYLAFLKGQFFLARRTQEDIGKAVIEFEKSIAIDPAFAPAYAALSNCADLQAFYGKLAPTEAASKIVRLANQALTLDPGLTEALLSLAEEKAYFEYDPLQAEDLFKRAIASNSRNAVVHQWYAEFLAYQNRSTESYKEVGIALEIDPLSLVANVANGYMHYLAGDYDGAIAIFSNLKEMDENFMLLHYWLGRTYLEKKDYVSGINSLKKAAELSKDDPMTMAALAYAYAVSGDKEKGTALLKTLQTLMEKRYVATYYFVAPLAALGDSSTAISYLERSIQAHASQTLLAFTDPQFKNLHDLAAFKTALAKIKPTPLK